MKAAGARSPGLRGFSLKALGRGSIAAYLKITLDLIAAALWIALGGLILGSLAYVGVLCLVEAGVLSEAVLTGPRAQGGVSEGGLDLRYDLELDGGLHWQIVAPALAAGFVIVSGGIVVVDRLKRLFASFTSGEPFRSENADHLRVIWITLAVVELARYALLGLTSLLITAFGRPAGTTWTFKLNFDLMTWGEILVLIVLAEVFREGARLREEQDLTI